MALVPDFETKLKDGCKTIHFIDKFNWGAPEVEASTATAAVIYYENSLGTVSITLDIFPSGFPNDTDLELDITSTIGADGTSILTNQCFYLTYTVTIPAGDEVRKKLIFIDCQAAECVDRMFADIDISDCQCDTQKVDNAIQAKALLQAARYAACCNNKTRWQEFIDAVMKLCKNC